MLATHDKTLYSFVVISIKCTLQQQDGHVRYESVQAMFGTLQNHCCAPSMYTKVLEVEGESRLVFFARTDIKPGQELTYDYR